MKAGWPITALGNEIDLLAGFAFKSARYTNDDEAIRLLRGDNIVQGCLRWDEVKKWPADDVAQYDNYQLGDGDVVLAMDRPWVKAGLKHAMISADDLPCLLVQRTARLRPMKSLDNRFLMYLIGSDDFTRHTLGVQTGIGVPHISGQQIKDFQFRMPPLAEQRRIVGILDEAFEGLATAKANAEQNLQNARALFESHLQAVFTQRGHGWVEKKLGEVAEVQSGGTPLVSQKAFWNGNIPWYSSGELNALLTTEPNRNITKAGLESSNAKVFPKGSLLIGMYDTAALKMSILDRDGAFNQAVAGVKPNRNIELAFILYAINAVKPVLLLQRRGVRQKNLSLAKIKDIAVPMPAPSEQRETVQRLRVVSEETQRLESLYQRKLAALDELKKSLLHRAFSGQL